MNGRSKQAAMLEGNRCDCDFMKAREVQE